MLLAQQVSWSAAEIYRIDQFIATRDGMKRSGAGK
jgi:hypothetical protein